MKICVIGAGAIGGLLAAKLARAGEDVSVVARGAHLAAIARAGLILDRGRRARSSRGRGQRSHRRSRRTGSHHPRHEGASGRGGRRASSPAIIGPRDADPDRAERHSLVVFLQAWRPARRRAAGERRSRRRHRRPSADRPRASAASSIRRRRSNEPGVIRHIEGNRFSLGEIDGSKSERIVRVVGSLRARRLQGAGRRRRARRNLDEALGQSELQPDQRADPRDARRTSAASRRRARSPPR